jgi:murein DD-endopeptidase MepM/ murein hydrolase activator NlpD
LILTSMLLAVPARADEDVTAARWTKAVDELVVAGTVVQGWAHVGTPQVVDRAWIRMRVRVRGFVHAGRAWLAEIAAASHERLEVPDLALLTIEPIRGVESSGYGWRVDPINDAKKFHKGTDYKADRGTPVHAAGDGVIAFTGRQKGYGNVIYVDHGGGLITRYAHLSKIDVAKGDAVAADTVIGKVGSTGRTTGPHLHFEIRVSGRAIDPVQGMVVARLQRDQPALAWLAAMSLLPEVQKQSVDAHDPPPGMRKKSRKSRPST